MREAGDILGVSEKVKNRTNPKSIIKYILEQIVNNKNKVDKLQEDELRPQNVDVGGTLSLILL